MNTVICGLQQVGVGVTDIVKAYNWYIKAFGIDIIACDADGIADKMQPFTGNKPRPRRAIVAMNLQGGGGMEVWQPKNETHPSPAASVGDYGIDAARFRTSNIENAYEHFQNLEGAQVLCSIQTAPDGQKHFFIKDPFGNLYDIVEAGYKFTDTGFVMSGSDGAMIGVSDMERSLDFYSKVLGLDTIICDNEAVFEDLSCLDGGKGRCRRVKITSSAYGEGPLGQLYGPYCLELVQSFDRNPITLFEGRWWGDPGFIQICLDVRNMEGVRERVKALGGDFVSDGGDDFSMGDADGHFTYAVDPDGTMIEFVETTRIPIVKKLGISINLRGRDPHKNLPSIIMKAMRFLRTKGI